MRFLLLVVALLAAGAGTWWVVRAPAGEPEPGSSPGPGPWPVRPALPASLPAPAAPPAQDLQAPAPAVLPRVGVVDPSEGRPLPDPQALPWEVHVVRPAREAGQPLAGAALLEAIGERLYVRVRQPADLDALRALRLDAEAPDLPLASALHLLEAQGWKAMVMDPRVLLYRAEEAERAGPREPLREAPR